MDSGQKKSTKAQKSSGDLKNIRFSADKIESIKQVNDLFVELGYV